VNQKLTQLFIDKATQYNNEAAALLAGTEKIPADTFAHQWQMLGVESLKFGAVVCFAIAGVEAETAVIDEVKGD
jgi:hypothetical protein